MDLLFGGQQAEVWEAGESMISIGRRFDRESSSVFYAQALTDAAAGLLRW